jgi:hypothetical protein
MGYPDHRVSQFIQKRSLYMDEVEKLFEDVDDIYRADPAPDDINFKIAEDVKRAIERDE